MCSEVYIGILKRKHVTNLHFNTTKKTTWRHNNHGGNVPKDKTILLPDLVISKQQLHILLSIEGIDNNQINVPTYQECKTIVTIDTSRMLNL